jgi:hypothetical protein
MNLNSVDHAILQRLIMDHHCMALYVAQYQMQTSSGHSGEDAVASARYAVREFEATFREQPKFG